KDDKAKGAKQAWDNIKKVRVGDYLAFHGYGGKNDLTIYQISKVTEVDENNGRIYFDRLSQEDDELYHGKAPKMSKGSWFGTLFPVKGEEAIEKIFGNFLKQETNIMNSKIQRYTDILRLKKNIILQGAPGTGKTYNTAALALSICGVSDVDLNDHKVVIERYEQMRYDKDKNPDGQIGFCTFHQSMDYEDFVEGIKPIKPDEGEMYYKVEDGIFKIMSKVAANSQQVKQAKTLDSAFDDLIQDIIDGNVKTLSMKNGGKSAKLSVSSQMTIKWETSNGNDNGDIDVHCVSKDRLLKLCEVYDSKEKISAITNINESIRNVIGGCNSSYYWAVAKYLLDKIGNENINDEKTQNYVLIIDEINRGNVSRIFGELITLLEKDKRLGGEHPIKVTLPYSKESFGVPENLYIIGTMNTTDRSVGNIDYAVRRRFAFVTLKSDCKILIDKYGEESQNVKLFRSVEKFIVNSKPEMDFEDLMVGHSYFFAENDDELALRWQYEILPLLNEYIKDDIIRANRIETNVTVDAFIESSNQMAKQ
ncbi:MAG: AAA family ATPase, partial [Bacteroidales bacterium]|nr:AAA family ATPase [Bacteroidales bacterium]